jgi:hypothetical protein
VGQQSSSIVIFRAVVMLFCLIAIPLAALFGSSLPGAVKAIQEGRWPSFSKAPGGSHDGGEALPFVPGGAGVSAPGSGNAPAPVEMKGPLSPPEPPSLAPRFPGANPAERERSGVVAAGFEAPIGLTASRGPDTPETPPLVKTGAGPAEIARNTGPNQPEMGTTLQPLELAADKSSPAAGPAPGQTAVSGDPFNHVQDRLRQLGATYYLLESWGGQQQLYRFYCRMAVGGNPNYTRYFEAIDAQPLKAMSQVLDQVESWRTGRP